MRSFVTVAAVGTVAFAIADALWLGIVMTNFYRDHMAPVARLSDGRFAPNWTAAVMVYLLLGVGIASLVVPRATSLGTALAYGGLFGFVVYGVYDFTNLSTLRHWPIPLALVDVAWGTSAAAACAAAAWSFAR